VMIHTERLLVKKFRMLPRSSEEATSKRGKCYRCALLFLERERERVRKAWVFATIDAYLLP